MAYNFSRLKIAIKDARKRLEEIADGALSGFAYEAFCEKYLAIISEGNSKMKGFSDREIRYIYYFARDSEVFRQILSRHGELKALLKHTRPSTSIANHMLTLYLAHYKLLRDTRFLATYEKRLLQMLKITARKATNSTIGTRAKKLEIYYTNFYLLEEPYAFLKANPNLFDTLRENYVKIDNINNTHSYKEVLKELLLIIKLKALEIDAKDVRLFKKIKKKKDFFVVIKRERRIKEFAMRVLLSRMRDYEDINGLYVFANWVAFILSLLGDPRRSDLPSDCRYIWDNNPKARDFFIAHLSRDDLAYFLASLANELEDTNYKYRQQFWLAFQDKVRYAYLMVNNKLFENDEIEIDKNKNFGIIVGTSAKQSAIYIDLGDVKVLEYTHSGKMRLFKNPLNLENLYTHTINDRPLYRALNLNNYIDRKARLVDEPITHYRATDYGWQVRALNLLNHILQTNITLSDIKL